MQLWTTRKSDKRTYFGVLCNKCGSPILFGVDFSEGHRPINRTGVLTLTCAERSCRWRDDYSEAPVSRYRKGDEGVEIVTGREKR